MKSNREEKIEDKLQKLQADIKVVRKELHSSKQKNRDLGKSRELYKDKLKIQQVTINQLNDELKKNSDSFLSDISIDRHKYQEGIVKLCVSLVCGCGLSLRSAIKIVKLINEQFHLGIKEIPCHNSIRNWIEKSGFFTYCRSELKTSDLPYGEIIDESLQIGSEKFLLSLGVKADKTDETPLTVSDVEILDISVEKNWNGALICNKLKETATAMGRLPDYVISDNASIMNKGIRESSLIHLRDLGHSLAMFLERQYKAADI